MLELLREELSMTLGVVSIAMPRFWKYTFVVYVCDNVYAYHCKLFCVHNYFMKLSPFYIGNT